MACECDGVGQCRQVVWAKVARDGGQHRGCYHAWTPAGQAVCANASRRANHMSKAVRQRQPWKACAVCLRILGLPAVSLG